MCIKSHDCVKSSKIEFLFFLYTFQMLSKSAWMQPSPLGKTQGLGLRTPKTEVSSLLIAAGVFSETRDYTGRGDVRLPLFYSKKTTYMWSFRAGGPNNSKRTVYESTRSDKDAAQYRKELGTASIAEK